MDTYRIVAFDMDGTLLTTKQTITSRVKADIDKVTESGKHVVVCTGRSYKELSEYQDDFANIRYYICANGTFVYDAREKQVISAKPIAPEMIRKILEIVRPMDTMTVFDNDKSIASSEQVQRMEYFHAERYKKLQLAVATQVDDPIDNYLEQQYPIMKINFYSASVEIRDQIYEQVKDFPVTVVYAEETGLEITPEGTSKGEAYRELCGFLDIPMDETIAVGDSDNDLEMLKAAGMAVAMGNARTHVKEICDVTVADNDHDGCAEVMERYML